MKIESARAWSERITEPLPNAWRGRILDRFKRKSTGQTFAQQIEAERAASLELSALMARLGAVRIPLDASDWKICTEADEIAQRAQQVAHLWKTETEARQALGRIAKGYAIEPPAPDVENGPAIKRMLDDKWWRRQLRAIHAREVEGAAIGLGYINRTEQPYVSNESVRRRAQQNERNAKSLEATTAQNELGQEYTLAELAAKGTANKAIRRAELMTRIAGFERIARDMGHAGLFLTLTCPSRMHKWRTVQGARVIQNPAYDGTLPNIAQQHLAKTWARIRAALQRRGIAVYGFRIAEPNHDGTPHWHMLVFVDPAMPGDTRRGAVGRLCAIFRRYALADSPDERGARQHRFNAKLIDWSRGSAAGYIAKYIAKNIDGYRVEKDLLGNDAIESSQRVEAWASTWRIRQFQQIGGPPVGPWRELRRVKDVPAGAPAHLIAAHVAVNKTKALDELSESQQQEVKGAQWDQYVKAQGGVFCGRKYAIRVSLEAVDGLNKYGEPMADKPIGIETTGQETYIPAHMAHMGARITRTVHWFVQSARHVWRIVRAAAGAIGRVFNAKKAKPSEPWTCVNNCTGESDERSGNSGTDHAEFDKTPRQEGNRTMGRGTGHNQIDGGAIHGADSRSLERYQLGT